MIIYDDNFLSTAEINEIKNFLLNEDTPWVYSEQTNSLEEGPAVIDSELVKPSGQFFYHILGGVPEPVAGSEIFINAIKKFNDKNGLLTYLITRIKANKIAQDKDSKGMHHLPHVDSNQKHLVFLYYVNDSDGDTVIFDKRVGDSLDNMNIIRRISPKAGAAIVFDGSMYHASSSPVLADYRCVVNANFLGKLV